MNDINCPAVLVSAYGQSKALSTAAIARVWGNRSLNVRALKCGPDLLDPMILEKATGNRGQGEAVYQHGSITASFLHFYFASNPQVAANLFLP